MGASKIALIENTKLKRREEKQEERVMALRASSLLA